MGVVIEEDGYSESDFLASLAEQAVELERLNQDADVLAKAIAENLTQLLEAA